MQDAYLIGISSAGIALSVWMIARKGFHPFFSLICAAFLIGVLAGRAPAQVVQDIEHGFGGILGGTGLVVTLGLALGAILQFSGGAQALAGAVFHRFGRDKASYAAMAISLILGLPLFFETGVVLLMPIIAAGLALQADDQRLRLTVMMSSLATLSVLHALLPPHPGPLIASRELGASLGVVMPIGLLVAIPAALIAGPLLARYVTPLVGETAPPLMVAPMAVQSSPWRAAFVLLFPVILIALGPVVEHQAAAASGAVPIWFNLAQAAVNPVVALLLAIVLALFLLFPQALAEKGLQEAVWNDAVKGALGIIFAIGAGGALKQVLVEIGLPDLFGRLATLAYMPPLLVAWLVAAAIRVATGSATVATITAAGVMHTVVMQSGIDPAWFVLAIGCGSVFLSHVNDPGFWLVKGYLGTSTLDTMKLWSTLETVLSIVGLALILVLYYASLLVFP